MTQLSEYAELWLLSALAALIVVCSKLGHKLFGISTNPPTDPVALKHWRRKRWWLLISELSAVPTFATAAVVITVHFKLQPIECVAMSMMFGALGFGFLLSGLQYLMRLKLERLKQEVPDA